MNNFALAFVGGIVGAVLMDITETCMARIGITSGVNVALVGRWFSGLTRGQLAHADILDAPASPGEARMGWAFHFLVGGGGVALMYPAFLHYAGIALPTHHLLGGVLFGWATSLLPWFVLLPAFAVSVRSKKSTAHGHACPFVPAAAWRWVAPALESGRLLSDSQHRCLPCLPHQLP